jgi:integrase
MRERQGSVDYDKGTYRVRVTLDGSGRKTVGRFPTRTEAGNALASLRAVVDLDDRVTVASWCEHWLDQRELAGNHRDIDNERSRYTTHIQNTIGRLQLRAITAPSIRKWLRALPGARQTRANVFGLLRGALGGAVEEGKLKTNPAIGITIARELKTRDAWKALNPAEQATLLAACSSEARALVAFAIVTGLRAGELCGLHTADIHDDRIVVRYGKPGGRPTKSGKIREVPMLPAARSAWDAWRALDFPRNTIAFPREGGGYRDPNHVIRWNAWKATLKRAKLSLRWHDLRHTCASSLV